MYMCVCMYSLLCLVYAGIEEQWLDIARFTTHIYHEHHLSLFIQGLKNVLVNGLAHFTITASNYCN